MTPAGHVIAEEIAKSGPISFSRFMETALYHPVHGYYRRNRDPFGKAGDFYTAQQLQPVFGRLIAQMIEPFRAELGGRPMLVELGAGRREMEEHFNGWKYRGVDVNYGEMPARFRGLVFSNEFFDALPVDVVRNLNGELRERRVGMANGQFVWIDSSTRELRKCGFLPEGALTEVNQAAKEWMQRIASALEAGYVLSIDYGYEHQETMRFPAGTLMSYRRHHASPDVLSDPGERDITSHVCFTCLMESGEKSGLETVRFETLGAALLRVGEQDEFAHALEASDEDEARRLRMQLKTLLFGMGDAFRVLVQRVGA